MSGLVVIETHPVQYRAPLYRWLQQKLGVPVTALYGSDFSIAGYHDKEFNATFAWETDLLSGYSAVFLSRVSEGGARSLEEVKAQGLEKKIQQLKPDVVLSTGYAHRFHQKAFYHMQRQKIPVLFRAEAGDHTRSRSFVPRWIRDCFLRWWYQGCEKLLYIGRHSYEHFKRLKCPEEKLIFSPYCVDTSSFQWDEEDRQRFRSINRQRLRILENQIVLIFSGKLSLIKGPDLLLKAVKELPDSVRKRVVTLLMGEGRLRPELEDFAAKLDSAKVHFLGFQNQKTLSPYYHAADLLVLPSRSELWGLVVNEALHHGLPCVVSRAVGSTPDLIEPAVTGEIFERGSVESLVQALERAFALIGRPEIREKCREKVSGYTVEKAAEGIAKAYWAIKK